MKLWLATIAILAVLVASATVMVATSKPPAADAGPVLNVTIPPFDQAAAERQAAETAAASAPAATTPAPVPAEATPVAPAGVGVTTTVE